MNGPSYRRAVLAIAALATSSFAACMRPSPTPGAADCPDEEFRALTKEILEHVYSHQPTQATYLGIHRYDDKIEEWSSDAVAAQVATLRRLHDALAAIDPRTLSFQEQLDRELVSHAVDSQILALDVVRPWAKDPDSYSSGITNSAYILIKRDFAPLESRLRSLIAREKAMPAALARARINLAHPAHISTEIAIQQIDGNRDFFQSAIPEAFQGVKDEALRKEFERANAAVVAAIDDYKRWLKNELLPRSDGDFALGRATYEKKLRADEMVDVPLDEILKIAQADLQKNQAAFAAAARVLDPLHDAMQVLAALQKDHPPAEKLLATTQSQLDELARFIDDHAIVTIPRAVAARVQETPPFMRATTSASMDTPGPFETKATEAYYSMTLPDPASSASDQEEFMKQWYFAAISNTSVHEVWPGHYLQFLYAKDFTSDARKVFGVNTNIEGWAHYCEQMMIDEGLHAGDSKYRLAQLQDALLRDARCIVGIRMHTLGMTIDQAKQFFMKEGYQPEPVADSEAKRGTSDPTYGYYTLGKLMILKLRDDYRAKMGAKYSLRGFHDEFINLGPLPLPLMRRAMLGAEGKAL